MVPFIKLVSTEFGADCDGGTEINLGHFEFEVPVP